MRLVRFQHGLGVDTGILTGEDITVLAEQNMAKLLTETEGNPEKISEYRTDKRILMKDVRMLAPVMPSQLFLAASNFSDHVQEGGGKMYAKERNLPCIFMKPPVNTVIGHDGKLVLPKEHNKIDWECELAAVIGKKGRNISIKDALGYVAGYTVCNDVSERQINEPADREDKPGNYFFDWLYGKWFDTFAPLGPCITLKDEIDDPQNILMKLRLNGETKQESSTRLMIYTVAELVSFISSISTLYPGDVISTGTVAGVGHWTGTYLKAGDVIEADIEHIGVLRNYVVEE